jgi:hypothetical protein
LGKLLVWGVGVLLVWAALREVAWPDLRAALSALRAAEVLVLLGVNILVLLSFSGRWWAILRGQGFRVPYLTLSLLRLAGFGVSYFTPGPQFGGEPLQAYLLHRRHRVPAASAAASVAMDKSIELLGNLAFLLLSLPLVVELGFLPGSQLEAMSFFAAGLMALPLILLLLLRAGWRPLARLAVRAPMRWPLLSGVTGFLGQTEEALAQLMGGAPWGWLGALGFTVVSWLGLMGEYALALRFLDLRLSPLESLAVLAAARLAFLGPFPGGLGLLEASQVFALRALGHGAAQGASMALLIRARDLLFGGLGLWLGASWVGGKRRGKVP